MSYTFYKTLHFLGLFATLISLGGIAFHMLQGGTKENFLSRKKVGALHGIGLVLVLVAGFGLMARGHFKMGSDMWLWGKLLVWLVVGAYPVFFYKMGQKATGLLGGLFLLLFVAVYLVEFKPF